MLRANFHTHTTFCDGTSTAEEMVQRALDLGFFALGFSGHMDPGVPMDWQAYSAEVKRLRAAYADRLDILLGAELDLCFDPATCADAEFIVGSTHYLPVGDDYRRMLADPTYLPTGEDGYLCVDWEEDKLVSGCQEYFGGDWYALCRAYFELEAQVIERTHCTFVGHFDLVTRFNDQLGLFDETDPRYLGPALEVMEHLVSQGAAFEINCGAINRGRKAEPYPRPELLRALSDFGGQIFINSDAHQRELLNGGFDVAVSRALDAGFTHVCVLGHDSFGNVEVREMALDTL